VKDTRSAIITWPTRNFILGVTGKDWVAGQNKYSDSGWQVKPLPQPHFPNTKSQTDNEFISTVLQIWLFKFHHNMKALTIILIPRQISPSDPNSNGDRR
jgi:hypothetical protein